MAISPAGRSGTPSQPLNIAVLAKVTNEQKAGLVKLWEVVKSSYDYVRYTGGMKRARSWVESRFKTLGGKSPFIVKIDDAQAQAIQNIRQAGLAKVKGSPAAGRDVVLTAALEGAIQIGDDIFKELAKEHGMHHYPNGLGVMGVAIDLGRLPLPVVAPRLTWPRPDVDMNDVPAGVEAAFRKILEAICFMTDYVDRFERADLKTREKLQIAQETGADATAPDGHGLGGAAATHEIFANLMRLDEARVRAEGNQERRRELRFESPKVVANYRQTLTQFNVEWNQMTAREGGYEDLNDADRMTLLTRRCIGILQQSHQAWALIDDFENFVSPAQFGEGVSQLNGLKEDINKASRLHDERNLSPEDLYNRAFDSLLIYLQVDFTARSLKGAHSQVREELAQVQDKREITLARLGVIGTMVASAASVFITLGGPVFTYFFSSNRLALGIVSLISGTLAPWVIANAPNWHKNGYGRFLEGKEAGLRLASGQHQSARWRHVRYVSLVILNSYLEALVPNSTRPWKETRQDWPAVPAAGAKVA